MTDTLYRYPGAQPFRDDEFSRRTFFGRETASIALTDQILANRLVVVYAKSGLGKTSLLSAGVAPRLREADSLPLLVRVNDIQRGPLTSVLEGIRAEAERQNVEYAHGESDSLWSFFKSVEFWRGDLLLTPVLILDQFEELFTLQSEEAREKFLSELGYLVRGIPPPSLPQTDSNVRHTPPSVRVVLSLREDFLGLLEEASDRIPQIMDHRFRLAPLTSEMAAKAITGPAAINAPDIATKPFRLEPDFVASILDYLTKSTAGGRGPGSRYVEPFHLQLICQRIEKIVAFKQQNSSEEIVFSFKDLGGEAALAQTLESFYTDAIRSVPGRHLRGAVRLLCEEFLISPEGRRLSLEERELRRQLKLPQETLNQLVERRLLRTDRRSDSTYYELSHDALVQPVLASRRTQALVVGWASVLGGSIVSFVAAASIPLCAYSMLSSETRDSADYIGLAIIVLLLLGVGALGIKWLRAGLRRQKRYRRHAASEFPEQLPTLLPFKDKVLGRVVVVAGSTLLVSFGLAGLYLLVVFGILHFTHGKYPHWLAWAEDQRLLKSWQQMHHHPSVEMPWLVVELSTIIGFGWMLLRQGARKLWPYKFARRSKASSVPGLDRPPSLVLASLKVLSGGIALVVAALGFFTLGRCASGNAPDRLIQAMTDVSSACKTLYMKNYPDLDAVTVALFFFSAFVLSIALLRGGVLDVLDVLRHRRFTGLVWAKVAAAVCGILIIASLLSWAWSRLHSSEQAGWAQKQRAQYAAAFYDRGTASYSKSKYDLAIQDYDQAIRLKSDYPEVFNYRGNAHYFQGKYDLAIKDYDEAIRLNPDYADPFNNRGYAYSDKGQYDRAIQNYDEAIRLKPDYAEAFNGRGTACSNQRQYDRAIEDFGQAIRLKSNYPEAFNNRGFAYRREGQYDLAIQDFDQAIRLKPDAEYAFNGRGLAYVSKGQYDRAIQDYDQAIHLKPDAEDAFFNRGRAKFYLAHFQDAAADFQNGVSLNPSYAYTVLWLHLARQNAAQDDAQDFAQQAGRIDSSKWPAPVVSLLLGQLTPEKTLAASSNPDSIKDKEQRCEAEFYIGEYLLLHQERSKALVLFRTARDTCPRDFFEYEGAVAEMGRLGAGAKSGNK